jgi:hypothetical protein
MVLGLEPKASQVLSMNATFELHPPQPINTFNQYVFTLLTLFFFFFQHEERQMIKK